MAYGVKYRLDFSDTEGNKRRLEIFKKDYDGIVYPLIGTANPVQINWEQDNDFYDPIIASNCEINLMQTDTATYEDFYGFDEREFLVKVYYENQGNGLFWEDIFSNWENYDQLWEGDGSGGFLVFWQGYLIQDTYQQKIIQTPFNVSFKAVDGLGLLKGVNFPIAPNNIVTLWECLYKSLSENGLEYNIFVKTDLKEENAESFTNVFEDVNINSSTYTDINTYKFDCAKVLYSILTGFNCRIFQSEQDFFIVNNADIATLEDITFRRYDADGLYIEDVVKGKIIDIPTNALPMGQDLIKEVSGGIIEIRNTVLNNNLINYIPNGNFEDGFTDWVYDEERVTLNANSVKGGQSARVTGLFSGGFDIVLTNEFDSKAQNDTEEKDSSFDFSFEVQFENGGFQSIIANYTAPYLISHIFREYVDGEPTENTQTFYYSKENKTWTETPTVNFFVYSGRGEWLTYNENIVFSIDGVNEGYLSDKFKVQFTIPSQSSGGPHIAMYLGGVIINWKTLFYLSEPTAEPEKFIFNVDELLTYSKQITNRNLTNILEYKDIYQGSSFNNFLKGYLAPKDSNLFGYITKFKRPGDANYRFIEDLTAQQRINDTRITQEKFEGTLKRLGSIEPIYLFDRLKVNFQTYTESKPLIIDTFKYDVKNNLYGFTGHLGDQETDAEVVFDSNKISYGVEVILECKTYYVQNNSLIENTTIKYKDCQGVDVEFVILPDSQSNDFCATTAPIRVSGSTSIEIVLVSEICLVGNNNYLLQKCSDNSTGWRTEQTVDEIDLDLTFRVTDTGGATYTVVGVGTEGASVGNVTNTGQLNCPGASEFLYYAPNGVTVKAYPAAVSGQEYELDGVTYLVLEDRAALNAAISAGRDLSTVVTTRITFLNSAFYDNTTFNDDISSWDTSNVTTMNSMFSGATAFNQNIGYWDTSNVVEFIQMFFEAVNFNQDIGNWDTSSGANFNSVFYGATSFNQNLNNWDLSSATTMRFMFGFASSFNGDITGWDTSNVVVMEAMFAYATAFNQNIGGWDTSSVISMPLMFRDCVAFNQDLSNWCVTNITSEPIFFSLNTPSWSLPKPVWGTCPS